jgi:uncharacterized protein (DUF58 family)
VTTRTAPGAAEVAARAEALRRLELRVTRKLDGLLAGDHEGSVRGAGSEAGDAREYQPGDDARRIDWNLTARSGRTHVRDTIADRELETWLVVDGSASLDFGTAGCEKRDLALSTAAAFGMLAARGGNRVGAVVFDGAETKVVPPRAGRDAVMALLSRLERRPRDVEGTGDLAGALRRARLAARRRGVVVVVSDLMDDSDWAAELRVASARHDVVVVELRDPREDELPDSGLLTLVDPETGRRVEVQTAAVRVRERFAAAAAARRDAHRRAVLSTGADHLVLSTDRDWLPDVARFVSTRRRVR